MTLTIADVERWNAGDVREVFHAASSRAQAAQDAADGIATLPAFTTWGGKAADAAREAIAATGEQLKAHSAEVKSVANTARTAADEIERIQSELATLKSDAAALDMEIDPTTNQVVEGPGFKGTTMESLLKRQQLQPRVDKLLAEANFIDFALAGAINRADGSTASTETPRPQPPGPAKAVVDAVQQPSTVGQEGNPATWQDLLLPGGGAVPGTDARDLAPTLQDQLTPPDARVPGTAANLDGFLFPPGTPLPGPPPSLMDRFNATRKAAGLPPLDPRADPEFIAQARDLLAQQGIPADQIDQRLESLIDMMERPVADVVPPERQRQPAPGFGDGFRESWFANEDFVKGLIGQAGPGAPGVWESWKNLGLGIGGTIADPIGAIQDEIERAKNAPSLTHYLGRWAADISQSAAAGPFLGPEALAGRVAVRSLDFEYDTTAGLSQELNHAYSRGLPSEDLVDHVSYMSTHYVDGPGLLPENVDRVVLGKWEGQDGGYIGEARKNGGIYYDTGSEAWDNLTAGLSKEHATQLGWEANERFLRTQMENGVSRIVYVLGESYTSLEDVLIRRKNSFSAMEIDFLTENAAKYGYRRVGNGWIKD
ncbi:hypothetical protein [[Mycobacterium] wendilense]|uniref:Tox-REase-5 domain-containing protein n=1 Tax=[Mycobacterium] wendilense TaxID=3064284 RepID=A0ABN9P5P9_9MYCO|nr:hypothetical protein [Mycolicibacterium sp. MU0050]CAJ1586167.1 hypothetical protein MU0050_004125 [Mycolicibacterium sp. MU0050]